MLDDGLCEQTGSWMEFGKRNIGMAWVLRKLCNLVGMSGLALV